MLKKTKEGKGKDIKNRFYFPSEFKKNVALERRQWKWQRQRLREVKTDYGQWK